MPVNLDAIPQQASAIHSPNLRRWIITGVLFVLISAGLIIWFWQEERAGAKFWVTAFSLPVFSWGSLIALRYIGYQLECVSADSWNKEREMLIASETTRGQRFAWLMDYSLINALESGKPDDQQTQQAAINKSFIISHSLARDGVNLVRHTALSDMGSPAEIFISYISTISEHVRSMVTKLPASMPCYISFDLSDNLTDLADDLYSKIDLPLRKIHKLNGLNIIDYWLDRNYDKPAALIVIGAQIYEPPPQDSGEALTIIMMCNRQSGIVPSTNIRIHRPQINKKNTFIKTMEMAMLWAKLDATAPLRGWVTGGKLASNELWSNACMDLAPKLTATRSINIDAVTGYTGAAAPWQLLILAARQCKAESEPQIIAVESSPSCHQLCAVTIVTTAEKM